MDQSNWRPALPHADGPVWKSLVDTIAADIAAGTLRSGTRLPPQRELAFQLGIGVGTVGKAYLEAERAGLVTSHVGRGTFVTGAPTLRPLARAQGPIDMARNVPPIVPALARLDASVATLRADEHLAALVDYTPTAGLDAVRNAGAIWLTETIGIGRARPERLIQTNGGQHALMLTCSSFARSGDTILCDRATYPGNRTIAAHGGWHLRGVRSDARGMDPEQLDRAAAESGARLVILIPTLHNPTTVTLDAGRRREIAEVACARDLLIVEDDIYRVFGEEDDLPSFADLAPERTVHISSLSKALAPGLRLAFILPPEDRALHERLLLGQQASAYCPAAAGGLLFAQWVQDGTASQIGAEVLAEAARRTLLARQVLGEAMAEPHSSHSLHVWLPMEGDRARSVAAAVIKSGVEVTPPNAPFGEPDEVSGLRLCLGPALDSEQLEYALQTVRAALQEGGAQTRGIV